MSDSASSPSDLLNTLAEEYLTRFRRGDRPDLSEYTARHPELAERIRALFPTLVLIEQIAPPNELASALPMGFPRQWGEYRLLREIGRGGMGVVYEAMHEALGRRVAIKVLPPALQHGKYQERFRREARAAARLHHTNIVPLFGAGEHEEMLFLVMQFIDGCGLDVVLRGIRDPQGASDGPQHIPTLAGEDRAAGIGSNATTTISATDAQIPPAVARGAARNLMFGHPLEEAFFRHMARLGAEAAEALAYAHSQGVLHRDIKPSNLILDRQGTIWVADFGLAKMDDSAPLTERSEVVGTLRYLAPERFRGLCDARSDVYALGVTLYEMLTLRPAFEGDDRAALIERIVRQSPPRPRQLTPKIPLDLETIVLKAMANDSADRYGTVDALADDLRRFLTDRPIRARRSSPLEHLRRWQRRNPAVARLTLAVALLLFLLTLGSTLAAIWMNRKAEQAQSAEKVALERLFDASLAQARTGRFSRRPGQRFASWKAIEQAADSARVLHKKPAELQNLRNEAIACLALTDLRLEQDWEGNPPGTNGLAFDTHFTRYAWSYKNEGIRIRSTVDHRELFHLPLLAKELPPLWINMHFSLSGRYFAVWYNHRSPHRSLQVWELRPGQAHLCLTVSDVHSEPRFAADERTLAVGLPDRSIAFYDLETGAVAKRLPPSLSPDNLAFRPDGAALAVASIPDRAVEIRDLRTGEVLRTLPHSVSVYALAWHPDGQRLATGDTEHSLAIWDLRGKEPPSLLEGHAWGVCEIVFDPSGDRLLSFGWDMTLRLWDAPRRRQLLVLDNVRPVGLRHDDRLMGAVLNGRQVQLWECFPSREYRELHGHQRQVDYAEFSPDGRWLASAGRDPEVRLWEAAAAREKARLPLTDTSGISVLWEPNGKSLLTYSASGLRRWPVQDVDQRGRFALQIGSPRLLLPPGDDPGSGQMSWCGSDGRLLALVRYGDSFRLIRMGEPARKLWGRRLPHVTNVAGSPDGRWLATGSIENGRRVHIWDAASGQQVEEWPLGDATVSFSPNGRWLATATGRLAAEGPDCRLWRAGSWQVGARINFKRASSTPPVVGFSPDSQILALVENSTEIRLLNANTLEEIVTLTAPNSFLVLSLTFSPDSSQLAAAAHNHIQLWDLRLIRARLKELNLDWDAPDYPPAPDPATPINAPTPDPER